MAKSNEWDGYCSVCRAFVRKGEGMVDPDPDARRGFVILCLEHSPASKLDPPKPPEASQLSSIHLGDAKYER
jgi:hypothetical protein